MAAGSVINEPNKGTKLKSRKYMTNSLFKGMKFENNKTIFFDNSRIGRVPAITMMTKTNIGSVKFRVST